MTTIKLIGTGSERRGPCIHPLQQRGDREALPVLRVLRVRAGVHDPGQPHLPLLDPASLRPAHDSGQQGSRRHDREHGGLRGPPVLRPLLRFQVWGARLLGVSEGRDGQFGSPHGRHRVDHGSSLLHRNAVDVHHFRNDRVDRSRTELKAYIKFPSFHPETTARS